MKKAAFIILAVLSLPSVSQAAIALRNVGTGAAGTTACAPGYPAGVVAGDVNIAFIVDHATTGNTTPPANWVRIGGAAGAAGRFQAFYCVGTTATCGAAPSWGSLTTRAGCRMITYSGVDNTVPMDVTASARLNASGTYGTTTISTVSGNAMIVAGYTGLSGAAANQWSNESTTSPGALTEQGGEYANSTYLSLVIATAVKAAAGATGASTATGPAVANAGILMALKPASPVTISGQGATANIGNLAATTTINGTASLSSQVVTGLSGNITMKVDNTFTLAGQQASSQIGNISATSESVIDVPLSGQGATALLGSMTIKGDGAIGITGQSANSNIGPLTVKGNASIPIAGSSSTASIGTFGVQGGGTLSLTGQSATSGKGNLSINGNGTISLSGQNVTASKGSLSVTGGGNIALSGSLVSGSQGNLSVSGGTSATISLTGQVIIASIGNLSVSSSANNRGSFFKMF